MNSLKSVEKVGKTNQKSIKDFKTTLKEVCTTKTHDSATNAHKRTIEDQNKNADPKTPREHRIAEKAYNQGYNIGARDFTASEDKRGSSDTACFITMAVIAAVMLICYAMKIAP